MGKSIWPWIFLLLGWIALASYICKKCLCDNKDTIKETTEKVIPVAKPATTTSSWIYNDGNDHKMEIADHFKFSNSSFTHLTPLTPAFISSVGSTVAYLKNNPGRALNITGYYRESEENKSILPNLGLARANNISKYLTSLGVPANQITTKGSIISDTFFKNNILQKGVDFAFNTASKSNDRISSIKDRLLGKPITLYFGTNQNTLSLSSQQRNDFADIIHYLANVSSSKLEVSGHTDSTGNRDSNLDLSKARASFVSEYLTNNGGINKVRINALGLGPDKPIDSNATSAGRAKNRRVEVTLR